MLKQSLSDVLSKWSIPKSINASIFVFFAISIILFSRTAIAETFNVSTTPELRVALEDAAVNGQADAIILGNGTYKTTDDGGGTFTFLDNENYDLTIQGSSPENVVLSGDSTNQVLNFSVIIGGPTIHLVRISVRNGNSEAEGGGIFSEEDLEIINCIITGNTAGGSGGGFYSTGPATIEMEDSTIASNAAGSLGGGFYSAGRTTITDSMITGNTAGSSGGGFYSNGPTSYTGSTVNGSTITGNTAGGSGGGFYSRRTTTLTDSTINGNAAGSLGGGFYCGYHAWATVTDSIITGNTAGGSGGGFYSDGRATVTDSMITGSTAGSSGGGFYSSGATIVTGSTLTGNIANDRGSGGGFYSGVMATVTDSTLTGNTAGMHGGGFYSTGHIAVTTVTDSTLTGNTAGGSGGGFYSTGPTFYSGVMATVTGSIISGNTAEDNGAGLYGGGDTKILNSIIINNINTEGVYLASDTSDNYILNSVFINNGNYDVVGASGVIATIYNNYIDRSKIDTPSFKKNNIFDGNLDFTDQVNGDFHIGQNSVLIDAGTTDHAGITLPETDMDGNPRIVGTSIDIGPYEFQTISVDSSQTMPWLLLLLIDE